MNVKVDERTVRAIPSPFKPKPGNNYVDIHFNWASVLVTGYNIAEIAPHTPHGLVLVLNQLPVPDCHGTIITHQDKEYIFVNEYKRGEGPTSEVLVIKKVICPLGYEGIYPTPDKFTLAVHAEGAPVTPRTFPGSETGTVAGITIGEPGAHHHHYASPAMMQ